MVPIAMIWETPCARCAIEDAWKLGAQPVIVEMSVGIDQWGGSAHLVSRDSSAGNARPGRFGCDSCGFRGLDSGRPQIP